MGNALVSLRGHRADDAQSAQLSAATIASCAMTWPSQMRPPASAGERAVVPSRWRREFDLESRGQDPEVQARSCAPSARLAHAAGVPPRGRVRAMPSSVLGLGMHALRSWRGMVVLGRAKAIASDSSQMATGLEA